MILSGFINEYKSMIPGLERIKIFLLQSGINYNSIPYVHIAGTNGKGSTAKILAEILVFSGYKTGLYISPHILKINERIQINSVSISDLEFEALYNQYSSLIKKHKLTFFECLTALALIYFTKEKVDIAVLETGLGGRFDATNIVTPLASVITSIDLDHKEILGGKLSQIALEKAGIIKRNIPVVCGKIKQTALNEIKKTAKNNSAKIYLLGKDFNSLNLSYNWKKYTQKIDYRGLSTNCQFDLSLLGDSQVYNAGIALCVCEILKNRGFSISFKNLSDVLKNIKWHARFDIRKIKNRRKKAVIIIDGCHNLQAVDNFLALYKKSPFAVKKNKLVFAVMQEKDYKKIIKNIVPFISTVNLVDIYNERAVKTEKLKSEFLKYTDKEKVVTYKSVEDCFNDIKNNEIVFCIGSFYLAGKIINFIEEKNV
ncbi:MAG: Mur ligase family protein [Endomicrobiaceae bacterium]